MNIATVAEQIDYLESDGRPTVESNLHRDCMFRIAEIFHSRYWGKSVYAASDLLVYYRYGEPTTFIVPDSFIVLKVVPSHLRTNGRQGYFCATPGVPTWKLR